MLEMRTGRSLSLMQQIFTESFMLCLPCTIPCVRRRVKNGKQILPFSAVTELLALLEEADVGKAIKTLSAGSGTSLEDSLFQENLRQLGESD